MTWKASAVSWKVLRGLAVSTVSRCDGAIEGFGGVIEVATELGDFDGAIQRRGGAIVGFDGAIEGSTVSYRRCH